MSHLQPRFIAKAKAAHKRSGTPRQMPRSMIISESDGRFAPMHPSGRKVRRKDEPSWFYEWYGACIPHLAFTLKKGK